LRAVVEDRDDLVKHRTQTVNRLHVLLVRLVPAGAPTNLSADVAAGLLRRVRPREQIQATLRDVAVELVAEVRHLDRHHNRRRTGHHNGRPDRQHPLTGLYGIGPLLAGKILGSRRRRDPVPFTGRVRLLQRHCPDRGFLRRRRTAPALPRRGTGSSTTPCT